MDPYYGGLLGNNVLKVERYLDLWPWMTSKEDTEGQKPDRHISAKWKDIDLRTAGKVGNGPVNAMQCKMRNSWKTRWRPSDNREIAKTAKTRPNEKISTWELVS